MKRPNLVFIFADQMRRDIGAYGNDDVITPNLDQMAAEGMRFDNTVCLTPQCSPARAAMLTGTYPTTNGILKNDTPFNDYILKGKRSIAYALGDAGYKRGYIGKWHIFGPSCVRHTFIPPGQHRLGFDDFWAVNNCSHNYLKGFYYLNDSPERVYMDEYDADHQTSLAIDFIEKNKNNPFALFMSWGPPHNPYDKVPEKWKSMYDAESLKWRPNVRELDENCFGNHKLYADPANRKPRKDWLAGYYAHISALDNNIGRILETLKQEGLDNDTIVVFTSDHGDMLWSQGVMLKNAPWEESAGIPFIIRYPAAIQAGTKTGVPFSVVDFMPTLLGLMGVSCPSYVQGKDLSGIMRGEPCEEPEAAYIMAAYKWSNYNEWRGVRTKQYTYARTLNDHWVLYDNYEDPYQMNNLVGNPSYYSILAYLEELTYKMGKETGNEFLPWDTLKTENEQLKQQWLEENKHLFDNSTPTGDVKDDTND